jgi:hypothetical protein
MKFGGFKTSVGERAKEDVRNELDKCSLPVLLPQESTRSYRLIYAKSEQKKLFMKRYVLDISLINSQQFAFTKSCSWTCLDPSFTPNTPKLARIWAVPTMKK